MTEPRTQECVLITGGANGLGYALARAHVGRGDRVCILDRDEPQGREAAEQLSQGRDEVLFFRCDLTDAADCERVMAQLNETWPGLDRLYNNAGIAGSVGKLEHLTEAAWQAAFAINVFAVARMSRLAIPMLKTARSGRIVNVASMAGLLSASHMAAYSASKAAVISLSETLQKELHKDGIKITVVCPAFFKTQLANSIPPQETKARASVEKLMANGKLSADDVAKQIIEASDAGRFHCLPHRKERWLWYLKRLSNRALHKVMLAHQA